MITSLVCSASTEVNHIISSMRFGVLKPFWWQDEGHADKSKADGFDYCHAELTM